MTPAPRRKTCKVLFQCKKKNQPKRKRAERTTRRTLRQPVTVACITSWKDRLMAVGLINRLPRPIDANWVNDFFLDTGPLRPCQTQSINQSINQSIKTRDAKASLGYPDRCLDPLTAAHRRLSSATRSNDDINWPVNSLMLSFHDLIDFARSTSATPSVHGALQYLHQRIMPRVKWAPHKPKTGHQLKK